MGTAGMMKRLHLGKTWQLSEAYVGIVAAESKLDSQHDFVVDHQSAVEFYLFDASEPVQVFVRVSWQYQNVHGNVMTLESKNRNQRILCNGFKVID